MKVFQVWSDKTFFQRIASLPIFGCQAESETFEREQVWELIFYVAPIISLHWLIPHLEKLSSNVSPKLSATFSEPVANGNIVFGLQSSSPVPPLVSPSSSSLSSNNHRMYSGALTLCQWETTSGTRNRLLPTGTRNPPEAPECTNHCIQSQTSPTNVSPAHLSMR